jgi:hypothetical protein
MISTDHLLRIFSEKLLKTGSFDDAFKKSHWIAYKKGIEDAMDGQLGGSGNEVQPQGGKETNGESQGQA